MLISHQFVWAHAAKTGGDATLQYFQLFPEVCQFADAEESPAKHTPFDQRPEQIRGKKLVLNIRRMPAWVLSWAQHRATYPVDDTGKLTPLPDAEAMSHSRDPDHLLDLYTSNDRFSIDHWLRMEYLAWDFLEFISQYTKVMEAQRIRIFRLGVVKQHGYDHDLQNWFTPRQVERLYENNPKWAALERRLYPDSAAEALLQQAKRQERAAMAAVQKLEDSTHVGENRLVFVIGSPRSGTTALANAVARHKEFYTSSESQLLTDLFAEDRLQKHYDRAHRFDGAWLVREGIDLQQAREFLGLGAAGLFSFIAKGRRWVDHTPDYALRAQTLSEMFPSAKFLHILRDGRDVVQSMQNFLNNLAAERRTEVNLKGVPWATDFRTACKFWVRYTRSAADFAVNNPEQAMTVRYETMVHEPEATFARIYRFLGATNEPKAAQFLRSDRGNSSFRSRPRPKDVWGSWSDEHRRIFVEVAGQAMLKFGFAPQEELEATGVKIIDPDEQAAKIRRAMVAALPAQSLAVVISKGDEQLLQLGPNQTAWHFPHDDRGRYAGFYPSDSEDAVAKLEAARDRGAQYLVVPEPSRWWLSHYVGFAEHLERYRPMVSGPESPCLIFDLRAEEAVPCR